MSSSHGVDKFEVLEAKIKQMMKSDVHEKLSSLAVSQAHQATPSHTYSYLPLQLPLLPPHLLQTPPSLPTSHTTINGQYRKTLPLTDESTCADIKGILEVQHLSDEDNSFKAIFWREQMKALSMEDLKSTKWHPQLIKTQESSSYLALAQTQFLHLPPPLQQQHCGILLAHTAYRPIY